MRETMAALFLRQCGYRGAEPVLDPMCGSGTFLIEAAEMALGLDPGRSRSFAFEQLAGFDAGAWAAMRSAAPGPLPRFRCFGSDRDAGAIASAVANAERAGVTAVTEFRQCRVSEIVRPDGPPGLVICNPPYGVRIGDRRTLRPLYEALGQTLSSRFTGWRVGIVTAAEELARATRLPFLPPSETVLHGGIRVRLWQTGVLP
jgi:putative N6-adenine-specific DNA methylase